MDKVQTTDDRKHKVVVGHIAGNTGRWSASTPARVDVKRSLSYGWRWVIEKGGPDKMELHLSIDHISQLADCMEVMEYLRSDVEMLKRLRFPDLSIVGPGLPSVLYFADVVIADVESPVLVARRDGEEWRVEYLDAF